MFGIDHGIPMTPRVLLAAIGLRRGRGGIAVVSRLMLRCLAAMGESGKIIPGALVLGEDGPEEGDPLFEDCKGLPIAWCGGSHARFCWRLARGSQSLTVFDHAGPARAQQVVGRLRRAPYHVFIHGIEVWERARADHLRALRGACSLLANSEFTACRAGRLHEDLPPIHVCPLALEADDFPQAAGGSFPEELGEHVILIVGRMSAGERYKGHEELIDAMPLIRGRVPDAQLVVVGGGDDARRLRMRAAASGSGNSVLFVGEVSDAHLHDLYEKCAIFAMPSRGEGFGLVYLEAMAHGKPCVGSIHDAAGEVIAHGETGLLVDPNDVDGMAEAISGLLLDKELRHGMGKLARDRQRQHFSFEQFASAFSGVVCEAFQ